jgi:CRISPR-associated protein Cmr6
LGLDYITPHKDGPLKNPTPLPFLKILPGVTVNFQFQLHDGYYLKAKGKLELFRKILLDFGVGAKTNVGYGQFQE